MLVDPPIEHHEAPAHWIRLRHVFTAIPEVAAGYREALGWRFETIPTELEPKGPDWYPTTSAPVPPGYRKNPKREEMDAVIRAAIRYGYSRLATIINESLYRAHARFGSPDANFRHIARDVWAKCEVERDEAITKGGTRLFHVHIERLAMLPVMQGPNDVFKDWFREILKQSPLKRTLKISEGSDENAELYRKARSLGVAVNNIEPLKREVFAEFPPEVKAAWTKPGNSPRGF
ncbi:hypothetical protein LJR090_001810 [Bosea sp. LjRoot90]|uniref:hypothetical protein n=1 Tax=Bosea sp. LjRoot90 TaxID=3342342 RepID=UPI003ED10B94